MNSASQPSREEIPTWERFYDPEIASRMRQFEQDRIFMNAHFAEWLEQFPDMFVAVYEERLVAVAATADELAKLQKEKGVPPGRSYWRFLSTTQFDLVVPA